MKLMEQPNALALEYQRDYGTARGELNILDLVNNPAANGKCRVFGLSFPVKDTKPLRGLLALQVTDLGDADWDAHRKKLFFSPLSGSLRGLGRIGCVG